MKRSRVPTHITEMTDRGFGLAVEVRRGIGGSPDATPHAYPSGDPGNDGQISEVDGARNPLFTGYRETTPLGVIGSEEGPDPMRPAPHYIDTVPASPVEQNDARLHGAVEALRTVDRPLPGFNDYASFQPRTAPIPRAAQDELYHRTYGQLAADPLMTDHDSSELLIPADHADRKDLYGRNRAGVLHNQNETKVAESEQAAEVQRRGQMIASTMKPGSQAQRDAIDKQGRVMEKPSRVAFNRLRISTELGE